MGSDGGFHEIEKDGQLFLEYHHPKYSPTPQTKSHDHPLQTLFLCPVARWRNHSTTTHSSWTLNSSPEYNFSSEYIFNTTGINDHPVLPLFWCNNKEFDINGGCTVCQGSNFGTDYYFCDQCDKMYHKECVESPLLIKHPYDHEHSLQLCLTNRPIDECSCCGRYAILQAYQCITCEVFMHPICAMKLIPFLVDTPKRHDHPLTLFPRQNSLTCNVCGLVRKGYPTHVCLRCNFVAHKDCMFSPHIIKISRHHHRISHISSFQSGDWFCRICHQSVDRNYGAYACNKCSDYVVHSRCALWKGVWDGIELESLQEEDDITQDAPPFDMITEGLILHFLHGHPLRLESNLPYDENKLCQACVLPLFEGNFYSCIQCDFILHQKCSNAPRRTQYAFHPHPLTLKDINGFNDTLRCYTCWRYFGGFVYSCHIRECHFNVDVQCALIAEPFSYQGHEHPLFLASDQFECLICHVCQIQCNKQLCCTKCYFILCIKCATLPYRARYKHDKHSLTIIFGKDVDDKDFCEVCEGNLKDRNTKVLYWCNECCTTFHIECILGEAPYMKHGQSFFSSWSRKTIQIFRRSNVSRPFCDSCKNRCQGQIFKHENRIVCSLNCM